MSRVLTDKEQELFNQICKLRAPAVMRLMKQVLEQYYTPDKVIASRDFVYARGTIPIGLVAHADTVHAQVPMEIFYDKDQNVIWSPEGLGADDRAGIYAIIDIVREGYRPTVLICNEEEVGGKGARRLVKAYPKPLDNLSFLIELDRMGEKDMVFYYCDNPDFEAYLEPYGFETEWGTYSDIATIAPKWGMAAVNLSIGYMDEHTKVERLYVDWFLATIDKVKNILADEAIVPHPFIFIEANDPYSKLFAKYGASSGIYDYPLDDDDYDDYGYDYGYGYNHYGSTPVKHASAADLDTCDFCGNQIKRGERVDIYECGQWFHLCKECAEETTAHCEKCGSRFFVQNDGDKVCSCCRRIDA